MFHCDLSRIDEAILRKGHMSYRYELGSLDVDKANAKFCDLSNEISSFILFEY